MSHSSTSSDLSRRLLLGSFGAIGASAALSACSGGTSTPPGAAPSSGSFGEGDMNGSWFDRTGDARTGDRRDDGGPKSVLYLCL